MKTIGILLRKDGNKYSFPLNFLKILCEVRVIPILPDITSVNNVDGVILQNKRCSLLWNMFRNAGNGKST